MDLLFRNKAFWAVVARRVERGLACPCRRRAAAERRLKDEGGGMKDEGRGADG